MVNRTVLVRGVVAALLLTGVGARTVAADPGGNPNVNACTGQVIAILGRQGEGGEAMGKVSVQDFHFVQRIQQLCAAGFSPEQVVQKVREAMP